MALNFRTLIFSALAIGAVGVGAWQISRPEQVPVDLEILERGTLEVTVNADAQTRIRDIFEVSAPVSGRVLRSPVRVGENVTQGETVVARIEPGEPAFLDARSRSQAEAAVAQAQAAVALADAQITAAETDLSNAQRSLNRLHDLHERGTIPAAQLEDAEAAVDIAAAQLDSAHATQEMRQSQLAAANAVLIGPDNEGATGDEDTDCCIDLTAPVSGEVLSISNDSARMVAAGAPLLSIGQLGDIEIVVELLSTDAVRIAPGALAYVERWGGDEILIAKVRVIEPAAFTKVSALGIEEQRVKVLLDFVMPADERPALGHNFRVYLRIVEWQGADVLRVPVSALFRDNGDWAVFVIDQTGGSHVSAQIRHVEIGKRNTDYAEVLTGLEAGDHVITHPSDRVEDGVLVVDRDSL